MNIAALVSGGVDSSVVVPILKEQGYDPHIFYIKIGMEGNQESFRSFLNRSGSRSLHQGS